MSGRAVKLPQDLARQLEPLANERGYSVDAFVRECLVDRINAGKPDGEGASNGESSDRRLPTMFQTMAEDSPVGIYCFESPHDSFLYVNTRFTQIVGYTREELLSDIRPLDLIHPEDRPIAEENVRERLRDGVPYQQYDTRMTTKGGLTRHVRIFGSRVTCGGQPAITGTLLDITDRIRQNEQLVAAKEEAQRMHRLKSSFLANMSHEIRTPITSILGFTDLLAEEASQENQHITDIIRSSGQRLLDTLDSVLYLAQLESGCVELCPDDLDIVEQVQNVARPFQDRAQEKSLSFDFIAEVDEPRVRLDPVALDRILQTLLDNAVKFTKEGSITLRIRTEDSTLQLAIQDTGIGIKDEETEAIFEAFRQESTGLQRAYEGSGLGLSIAQKLVELHEGSLEFESEKGRGTTVTVSLPCPTTDDNTGAQQSLFTAHEWGLKGLPPDQSVLVVEDDGATRELIPELLPESYTVEDARNVEEALTKAEAAAFDLIFMDINLKDQIDGVELMKRLREQEAYEHALFVAVTAYAMPGDGERFHAEGFDGYVPKPFTRKRFYDNLLQIW